ncbi:hypothetical protein UPYG_G00292050 [Umbra pygmaea]|uniref:Uncharacterized protein n=1 Tax=Umbra pygmaea TaxID=75934 RepID=A0ABD0W955_UMBPY
MPGGSTLRKCPHCFEKINCANRRCTKCGKLLELKKRQTARLNKFRATAKQWAEKVTNSRNQAKVFDNSSIMVEKLKALGYFPLLLWGRYAQTKKKWTAQLQCPFELPAVAHGVLEKVILLFESFLEGWAPEREEVEPGEERAGQESETEREIEEERGQEGREVGEMMGTDMEEMDVDVEQERGQEGTGPIERVDMDETIVVKNEEKVANRMSAVTIVAKKQGYRKKNKKDKDCAYHLSLDIFPVQYVSRSRVRKGRKEVQVHWLPCPSCRKTWPPSWEPQENITMSLTQQP